MTDKNTIYFEKTNLINNSIYQIFTEDGKCYYKRLTLKKGKLRQCKKLADIHEFIKCISELAIAKKDKFTLITQASTFYRNQLRNNDEL